MTNDYLDTSVTGNHTVDYYYPSFDAKNQTTNTSATPKVYKYWIKASSSSDSKTFSYDAYYYYKDGDDYELYWEETYGSWSGETLSASSSWKLETPENMKYVVGESDDDYWYAVGSHSVYVGSSNAGFYVASVGNGKVMCFDEYYICDSESDEASYGRYQLVGFCPSNSISGIWNPIE